jgi:hypothetical protein
MVVQKVSFILLILCRLFFPSLTIHVLAHKSAKKRYRRDLEFGDDEDGPSMLQGGRFT